MKILTVPVSVKAMCRLDYDECKDGDLIELLLNESEYQQLCSTEIFGIINSKLDKNIDDYEDDSIIGLDALHHVREIILERKKIIKNSEVLDKLLSQVDLAIRMETGLFLFF